MTTVPVAFQTRWKRIAAALVSTVLFVALAVWALFFRPSNTTTLIIVVLTASACLGLLVYLVIPDHMSDKARRGWAAGALAVALLAALLAVPRDPPVAAVAPGIKFESARQLRNDETISVVFPGDFPPELQTRLDAGVGIDDLEMIAQSYSGLTVATAATGYSTTYQIAVRGGGERNSLITGIRAKVLRKGPPVVGSLLYAYPQGEGSPSNFGFLLDSADLEARVVDDHGEILAQHYLDKHYLTLGKDEVLTFNVTAATKALAYDWELSLTTSDGQTYEIASPAGAFQSTALGRQYRSVYGWTPGAEHLVPCSWPDGC